MTNKILPPREYIYNRQSIEKCLNEAVNTYIQLVEDQGDLEDSVMDELINHIRYLVNEENEYLEEFMLAKDLAKYKSLHACEYDLEDDTLPDRAFTGAVVVIVDGDLSLTIDGNHRKNTLIKVCPEQKILVIEIYAPIPSNIANKKSLTG